MDKKTVKETQASKTDVAIKRRNEMKNESNSGATGGNVDGV